MMQIAMRICNCKVRSYCSLSGFLCTRIRYGLIYCIYCGLIALSIYPKLDGTIGGDNNKRGCTIPRSESPTFVGGNSCETATLHADGRESLTILRCISTHQCIGIKI